MFNECIARAVTCPNAGASTGVSVLPARESAEDAKVRVIEAMLAQFGTSTTPQQALFNWLNKLQVGIALCCIGLLLLQVDPVYLSRPERNAYEQ
jgi:hypothetical protein